MTTPEFTPELREEIIAAIVIDAEKTFCPDKSEVDVKGKAIINMDIDVVCVDHARMPDCGPWKEYWRKVDITSIVFFVDESPVEVTPEVRESIQNAVNELL